MDADMAVDRFTVAVAFAIDLACLVSTNVGQQHRLQRMRSTGELGALIRRCLTENDGMFGSWVDERVRIESRMNKADRQGGFKVWSSPFLESHTALVKTSENHAILIDGREVHQDGRLDPNARRYRRRSFFRRAGYRLSREGALIATYQVDFLDNSYAVPEVIRALSNLRDDAFQSFYLFLRDYFGNARRQAVLGRRVGLAFDRINTLTLDELDHGCRRHALIFIRGFWDLTDDAAATSRHVRLRHVLESGELAGILTEAPWFDAYGNRYLGILREKEIGHRGDEIYLIGYRSTVVVAEHYWRNLYPENPLDASGAHLQPAGDLDPLYWYQADLLTMIEHQLARLAMLRQQLSFFRDRAARRPLEAERPGDALPLVLDGRANLTLINESLDFTRLTRHGFTREYASALRREMGLDEQLEAVRRRIGDMSQAVNLKSSVTSARAGNAIQAAALIISVIALVVSIFAIFFSQI
jgi:hypothetical protein